jgi:hypothetical protein
MRIKLVVITGAAILLTAGTGAAYAVVAPDTVNPTVTGNHLPIDDNHSPVVPTRTTEPGEDRGSAVEPGDDRGSAVEPRDDRGGNDTSGGHGGHGGDDGSGHH